MPVIAVFRFEIVDHFRMIIAVVVVETVNVYAILFGDPVKLFLFVFVCVFFIASNDLIVVGAVVFGAVSFFVNS